MYDVAFCAILFDSGRGHKAPTIYYTYKAQGSILYGYGMYTLYGNIYTHLTGARRMTGAHQAELGHRITEHTKLPTAEYLSTSENGTKSHWGAVALVHYIADHQLFPPGKLDQIRLRQFV
ncbi:hypothetical protein C8F01DRAFT_1083076 [Mycena amicta]|nr:hypothetical protein C8F01DRAFT_1083076 [Mycena amicta]